MMPSVPSKITFTNPRLRAEFDDWPIGGANRGKCVFQIHHDKRGYRVERSTTNKNGDWCKPKFSTYGGQAVIVDGSDGRTYIVQDQGVYGFIKVMASDFMDATTGMGRNAAVFKSNDPELHADLAALIVAGFDRHE